MSLINLTQVEGGQDLEGRVSTLESSVPEPNSFTNPTHVRQTAIINTGSLYGNINIGANVPVKLHLGDDNLAGRHTVLVINTSTTNPIYIGFDNLVTKNNGIPVNAGQERSFSVNPAESLALYAFAEAITSIRLVEVK
jgi:hypothetical protein